MLIKTFGCLKMNIHFHEKGRITIQFRDLMNKTKDKEQKSQTQFDYFKGANEVKHFIIATIIEQSGN